VTLSLFIACAPGLEPMLTREVGSLAGLSSAPKAEPGGVRVDGTAEAVVRANIELGLASHVLVRIETFSARHFGELERKLTKIAWPSWIGPGAPWRVEAVSRRSKLYHTGAITQRIERAVSDALGTGPSDDPGGLVVRARFVRDRCTLSLDTSGEPLHRRGWRQQTAKAPLREDLARALVLASGWQPGMHLLDPMMGSGTLLIEAATVARGWAPGRGRAFGGRYWPAWSSEVEAAIQASTRPRADSPGLLWGRDRDPGSLKATEGNAARAGVSEDLDVGVADVTGDEPWPRPDGPGVVVCNPPYGLRVGRGRAQLRPLFEALGDRLRGLDAAWRVAVIAPDRKLLAPTAIEFESVLGTSHGGLDVEMFVGTP
jgi:putative N6-adenine-specific DNA methylase